MKIKDPNIKKILEEHSFTDVRGLNDYIEIFAYPFVSALKDLKNMNHWLDAGAGEAKAIREYYLASMKHDIFTTAITLKISAKMPYPTHKTVVNYVEELQHEDLRPCDIITDIAGALQYSEQPDVILKRYFLWLRPQGKLFIYLKAGSTEVEKNDEVITFSKWLKTIPALRIEEGTSPDALIIEKEQGSHYVPRLKLVESRIDGSLYRKFKEV